MRTLHIVGSGHLVSNVVLFIWMISVFRIRENLKGVDYSWKFENNIRDSRDLRCCLKETVKNYVPGVLDCDSYLSKDPCCIYKKEKYYSDLFSFSPVTSQKLSVFPGTLKHYFNELETDVNKSYLMRYEWARYETFKTFPVDSAAMPIRLASNGFYYNGTGDRVTCFSCGLQYQDWKEGDIVSEVHIRLSPNCNFQKGFDSTNIGIHTNEVEGAQGGAYQEANTSNSNEELQIQKHCRRSPDSKKITDSRRQHKHPDYDSYQNRMDTFDGWPYPEVIEPCVLAEAGFFFVGFGDCVRCFSCGGGLRNWQYGDGPWGEHARWFPWCRYLRERKSSEFIRQHEDSHTDTSDDPAEYFEASVSEQETLNAVSFGSGELENENKSFDSRDSINVSENENRILTRTRTQVTTKEQERIEATLCDMGFSSDDVRKVMKMKGLKEIDDSTLDTLIDDLLVRSATNTTTETESPTQSQVKDQSESVCNGTSDVITETETRQTTRSAAESTLDTSMLEEENSKLKYQLSCKICMENDADIVFLPCGHMAACETCAGKIRKCAICRKLIKGRVKAFMG